MFKFGCGCSDIDECLDGNGGCAHNCINRVGSHECSCREGFALGGDGMACEDVDECLNSQCAHSCFNLVGGFRCECDEGYILATDRLSCVGMLQDMA